MSECEIHIPKQFGKEVAETVVHWIAEFPALKVFQMSISMAGMMIAEIQTGREPRIKLSEVDFRIRTISELRMCGMVRSLPLPENFRRVNGSITKNGQKVVDHWYFSLSSPDDDRNKDIILCPTFGQIADSVNSEIRFERGERIQYLKDLIVGDGGRDIIVIDHPESPEYSFLLATRGAIERVFGLKYDYYHD